MDLLSIGCNRVLIFSLEPICSIWQLPSFFRLWAPLAKPSQRFRKFFVTSVTVSRVLAPIQQSYSQSPGTCIQAILNLKYLHSMPSQLSIDYINNPHVHRFCLEIEHHDHLSCHITWNKTLYKNRYYNCKHRHSEVKPMQESSHQVTPQDLRHYMRMGIAVASTGAPKPNL